MPIRVDCLTCRKWYKAPEKAAGKVVTCPGCGGELKVPADAPLIGEVPKASAAPRPAPAKPAPPPVPAPELPTLEDDDPFSIPGFPSMPSGTSAQASVPALTTSRPPAIRRTRSLGKGFKGFDLGGVGRFMMANPLIVMVASVATLLLTIGLFVRGQWFGVGGVLALAGYGLVAMGLFLPPPKRRRPVRRENSGGGGSIFNPFAAGGIGLVGVIGVVVRALGRVNRRAGGEGGGPAREVDPYAVAIGLGTFALVIGVIVGLFMSIRRYGLYATLAPIYVGIGGLLGLVMVISIGSEVSRMPRGFRAPSQTPAFRSVAEPVPSAATVEILNTFPLTPVPAKPLNARVGEASTLAGISRRTVTIDSPFGLKSITGTLEIHEPVAAGGVGQERQWPCVILAPAGSNLLSGRDIGDGDHPEALPWANAGYVVIQVALPGAIADPERVTGGEVKRTFAEFSAARAGLGCVEQVLAYIKQELPQVDPRRIAAVGHSSAGTLALLAAESNPEIKACVAFAPCTDVTEFHRDNFAVLETVIPTVRKFCSDYSPITHVDRLQCPIFFFQADDDSVTPVAGAIRFVDAAKEKQKLIEFVRVPTGDHYQSMIDQGIPRAIRWLDATFARATAPRPVGAE